MPIHFRCPHCDKLLALGTRHGGTQIHCPMCAGVITVPRQTQVEMPTTTVVLPDLAQTWWMDAPPVLPPKVEPPPVPPPPADAWWLTANTPPTSPENAIPTTPPTVPPPLPEAVVSSPPPEPPTAANEALAPVRSLPRGLIFLVAGSVLLAALAMILLLLLR